MSLLLLNVTLSGVSKKHCLLSLFSFSTMIYYIVNALIYSFGECIIEMFYREETPSSSWLSKVSRMYVLIDTNCLIYFAYCSILETSVIAYAQFISSYKALSGQNML